MGRKRLGHRSATVESRKTNSAAYAWAHVGWPLVLSILLASLYLNAPSADCWLLVSVLIAIAFLSSAGVKMRVIDWSVLAIAAFEIPSVLLSEYRANSIRIAWVILLAILVYYVIRLTIRTPTQIAAFSAPIAIGGSMLGLYGLHQFSTNARLLREAGFSHLVAFRSRLVLPRASWIPGEWFTLLLLVLPFACALVAYLWQHNKRWAARSALTLPLMITATLFLSLSRAVFWSTIIFYVAICVLVIRYRIARIRTGALLFAFSIAALILILAGESLLYPGVSKAYTGQHISQFRSTQGRLTIWKRSVELVRTNPPWGVGSGNAALSLLSTADADETTGFASRTFSLPVQVLLEKGTFGFLLYGTFVLLAGIEFMRGMRPVPQPYRLPRRSAKTKGTGDSFQSMQASTIAPARTMRCCFAAGFIAVLVRELTYSSILEHSLTLVLVMTLAALLCVPERDVIACG